jgi:short-subunit dehydrogenase
MRDEQPKVAVITGASSGLGREAAREFASRGFAVVLAARRRDELEQTAATCRALGAEALVVPTDVTCESDVQRLVAATLTRWSRIDTWVNNAGVTLFSPLEEGPFEEHRRVIETNLFGSMHGARAVIPVFRRQKQGVLINVGSVLSKIGQAFVPSYVISKFALRGLSEALRVELADEPDIHVCTLFPYAIDTPHFQTGANELGRKAYAMPPMQTPEKVARALVDMAEHPRRERHVPRIAFLGLGLHFLRPRSIERLLLHALEAWHLGGSTRRTAGNLYRPPSESGAVHGHRKPRIVGPAFAAWAVREYVKIEAEALTRRLHPQRAHAEPGRA